MIALVLGLIFPLPWIWSLMVSVLMLIDTNATSKIVYFDVHIILF